MDMQETVTQYQQLIAAFRPLAPSEAQQLKDFYRIGLTYTSNAIEGNSLTISETKVILEDGLTVGGKPLRDVYEAVGHAEAFDYMYSLAQETAIHAADAREFHRLFYRGIDPDKAGAYRNTEVIVTGSAYPLASPQSIQPDMGDLFDWYNRESGKLHPVEAAAELHRRFVYIHPFVDGNGRTARLLMNLSLLQRGYQIICIPPICRADYIGSLEKAHTEPQAFTDFIMEREVEAQREFMRLFHIEYRQELGPEH